MTKRAGKRRPMVPRGDSGSSQQLNAVLVNASERSIAIDVSRLAPPQNIYDADCAGVEHRRGDVRLFFGKLKLPRRDQLRSRIEIRYPVETFYKHLWQNSRGFHERLRQYAQQWSSDYGHDQLILTEVEAEKDHSEWANFDYMAHSGTEAAIDFFHLPAAALARFKQGSANDLELAAILRVQLTAYELLRLLDRCADVVSEIESYLPNNVREG